MPALRQDEGSWSAAPGVEREPARRAEALASAVIARAPKPRVMAGEGVSFQRTRVAQSALEAWSVRKRQRLLSGLKQAVEGIRGMVSAPVLGGGHNSWGDRDYSGLIAEHQRLPASGRLNERGEMRLVVIEDWVRKPTQSWREAVGGTKRCGLQAPETARRISRRQR